MAIPIPRTRFSLRFLLLLILVCGCLLMGWRAELRPYQRQGRAIAILRGADASFETTTGGRAWLRRMMGDEAFQVVTEVDLRNVDDAGTYRNALPLIPTVKSIYFGHGLADEDLQLLTGCPNIRRIDLSQSLVTDDGLRVIRNWPRLRLIHLGYNHTDQCAATLSHQSQLAYIDFRRSQLTDVGLQKIVGLPALHKVVLDGRPITDAGLEFLFELPSLDELYLQDCTFLSDAGLRQLARLKLKRLDIRGCRLTPLTEFYLREQLPGCEIQADINQ